LSPTGGKLDIEIVGVVEDVFSDIRDAEPLARYMPMAQQALPPANRALVFRAGECCARRNRARRWVAGFLPLGAVAVLILLLTVATSLRPALRAARVDLAEVLSSE
jgi:hypothetical protein